MTHFPYNSPIYKHNSMTFGIFKELCPYHFRRFLNIFITGGGVRSHLLMPSPTFSQPSLHSPSQEVSLYHSAASGDFIYTYSYSIQSSMSGFFHLA